MIKLPTFSWISILPGLFLALSVAGLLTTVYSYGRKSGEESVQGKWDSEKVQTQAAIARLSSRINKQMELHSAEEKRITDELFKAKTTFTSTLAAINVEHTKRLLNSEKRATVYQRMSEAGSVESGDLASHTAKLDQSLEEGRQLVGELKATLGQRDRQLTLLGEQLLNDRKVIGESDGK